MYAAEVKELMSFSRKIEAVLIALLFNQYPWIIGEQNMSNRRSKYKIDFDENSRRYFLVISKCFLKENSASCWIKEIQLYGINLRYFG